MSLLIERLGAGRPDQDAAWDAFVGAAADGSVFHTVNWRDVVQEVFGHKPRYLMATENGTIRAVLPLFELYGLLSGHVMVSVPYGVYGGLCGEDAEARARLLDAARMLAHQRRVRHVELRHQAPTGDLPTKGLYWTFVRPLDSDPDVNFAAIPGKQRRMIRQGIKHGLLPRWGWEHLGEFYEVYAVSRRGLGSPPFPRRLFEAIRDHFGKTAELLTVWHGPQMVAGVISLLYRDNVMPYYGAARPEAFPLAVNDFMYWELMREGSRAGFRRFDFGRSRQGTGSFNFKRHWGFQPKQLAYEYLLAEGTSVPTISPSNPRLRLFIETWKRLPLAVTKALGPMLTGRLPLD